jgi:hypothetical protein
MPTFTAPLIAAPTQNFVQKVDSLSQTSQTQVQKVDAVNPIYTTQVVSQV